MSQSELDQSHPKTLSNVIKMGLLHIMLNAKVSTVFAVFVFGIRTFLLIIAFLDLECFPLSDTLVNITNVLSYSMPFRIWKSFSILTSLIMIGITLIADSALIVLLYFCAVRKITGNGINYVALYGYAYKYVIALWLFGQLLGCAFLTNTIPVLDLQTKITETALIVMVVVHLCVAFAFEIMFVNFSLEQKDSLSHEINLSYFIVTMLYYAVIFVSAIPLQSPENYKWTFMMALNVYQLFNLFNNMPYNNSNVRFVSLLTVFVTSWLNVAHTLGATLNFVPFKDHFFEVFFIGNVLISINLVIYKNRLMRPDYFSNLMEEKPLIFNQKMKAIYFLIKQIGTPSNVEFDLISIVFQHYKQCTVKDCVCKFKDKCYDTKTDHYADPKLSAWKDPVFLKNLINSVTKQYIKSFGNSVEMDFFFILFSIEALENTVICNYEIKKFSNKYKGLKYIGYTIAISLIKMRLSQIVNSKPMLTKYGRNQFEKLIEYDRILNLLKFANQAIDHRHDQNIQTILGSAESLETRLSAAETFGGKAAQFAPGKRTAFRFPRRDLSSQLRAGDAELRLSQLCDLGAG